MHKLDKRLSAISDLVGDCEVFCDIGSDHAYLPLWLLANGKANHAIATDAKQGPLDNGKANALAMGLESRCEFRFGPGFDPLKPGEAECVCIAGMGGQTIIEIFASAAEKAKSFSKFILEPQSRIDELRLFLASNSYQVQDNRYVVDGKQYYQIMLAEPVEEGKGRSIDEIVLPIEPAIAKDRNYEKYLLHRRELAEGALEGLSNAKLIDNTSISAKSKEISIIESRLKLFR